MDKIDARKLSTEAQQALRNQAVRLRKAGKTNKEVAGIVGVHPSTSSSWWAAYQRGGKAALDISKRGREVGEKRTLAADQEAAVVAMITDQRPDQFKLPFALWNRRGVQQLIKAEFGIDMPIRTVGEYLKRWGFTPQKPIRRAYEQSPAKVKQWLEEDYPALTERAKAEGAEIHWGDETGLRSDTQHGRGYAPRGKTPELAIPAKRHSINMISSITNQGKVRFMLYRETMNHSVLIRFMKRLIKDSPRKVFLILDNLRVHHARKVREWLALHSDAIEVFYLPSYSPELNPDEYLNCDLKDGVHRGVPTTTRKQLEKRTLSHMRKLQKRPNRVRKYFKHPRIAYAA